MSAARSTDPDGYMTFIGVRTGGSSIFRVFPAWADELGLPVRTLRGYDLPLGAPPEAFREAVAAIRRDPHCRGALVTTHKMAVYRDARDELDELDELARLFGEVSAIRRAEDDRLVGSALDPVTVRLALDDFLPADHFARSGGHALVLGSGGAGSALSHVLGRRPDPPSRLVCTALEESALWHQRALHRAAGVDVNTVAYVRTPTRGDVDDLFDELPPGSLVVNATGLGKDRPGSPIGDSAVFPHRGLAWDFNYRGSLEFLAQAHAQQARRELVVEDGWRYFVHGWSRAIAEIFGLQLTATTVDRLAEIAAEVR